MVDVLHLEVMLATQTIENLTFASEEVIYSTATKVATSDSPFTMTQNEDKIVGKALVYDFELKKAYIKKAFALIEQDRKR